MTTPDERFRLQHILMAVEKIESFIHAGEASFRSSILIQHAVFYNLTVIGEAARAIPAGFRERYPDAPWPKIIGLRNILTHEYYRLKLDIVWKIVSEDLLQFKKQVQVMLDQLAS